jgi:hypothetical protein
MIYKFPLFENTIVNPTIEVSFINNNLLTKSINVDLILITLEQDYGVNFDGLIYESELSTNDVIQWAFNELQKYEVNGNV